MINYARHDEEFFGIFKLVSGDEVLGKAVLTEDDGQTLVFIQDPVCTQIIHKETEDGRTVRGMGFAKWMQFSDEDFFILPEKDIITVTSMSKEVSYMYQAFIMGEDIGKKDSTRIDLQKEMGHLGTTKDARSLLEKIYKSSPDITK
tara:strand:+ start:148 stop:585 length:438 start_codon:yes stop_codon:yes gene_type:complete